jgi:PadR family transcriptional regulator, regulatory protein AphA
VSSAKLTTTQSLILATIAWRGPVTPYQLKDYFSRVVRFLVEVPHTLLYTEPPKLAALGLLDEEVEPTGRRRKTYSITDAGLEQIRRWLQEPPEREPSTEDEAMFKLMYAGFTAPVHVATLARHEVEFYEQRIALLSEAIPSSDHDAERRRYIRTGARLALEQAKVMRDFWLDVEQDPNREVEATRRGI